MTRSEQKFVLCSRTVKLEVPTDWDDDTYNATIVKAFEDALNAVVNMVRVAVDNHLEETGTSLGEHQITVTS